MDGIVYRRNEASRRTFYRSYCYQMTPIFCKSGICDRAEGFAIAEVSTYFDPDRTLICKACKVALVELRAREAERYRVLLEEQRVAELASRQESEARRAENLARQIAAVMLERNEPDFVMERSKAWVSGGQHLGGPYYKCPQCGEPKLDPLDFDLIYKRGKKPLFNGETLCDYCFAKNNSFF